jgi:indolepyruvate ferredoxin oxidoreductase
MTSTAELSSPSSANTDLTKGVVDADLPERRAGAGAPAADAAAARRTRRAEHRRLHLRLSRLAAGRLRPGAVAGQEAPRILEGEVPAGPQRGPGATMVWGTQQTNLFPGATVDGVFGMWYGKGPGVDRCGDVFKHANAAGTSKHGGVLAVAGDDHNCRSSTLPHGSEHEFVSAMMPVLNPAGVQDILDMGLLGWAMSRFTGRWVGFKTIAETVESSASVDVDPFACRSCCRAMTNSRCRRRPQHPLAGSAAGPGDAPASLRGQGRAGVRARQRHRPHRDRSANARLGIVTTGKSYLDVLQALEYLGLDEDACRGLGIRVYKVGMTWPLEPVGIRAFARGLQDILVVEEKHSFIESQIKELFYNWRRATPEHRRQVRRSRRMDPAKHRRADPGAHRRRHRHAHPALPRQRAHPRGAALDGKQGRRAGVAARQLPARAALLLRLPAQHLDQGAGRLARAGRHRLPLHGDVDGPQHRHLHPHGRRRRALGGQAPFTETPHIFQNLGDGTYFHSARWRSASRSRPASTSPTRSSTTTRWR